MRAVGLTVNGIPVIETVEPRMHLADLLRERLGLTGTHLRCEQGACGACTLLIDGQPARSCITYAVLCEGAQITTIEGLEDDPVMAALRQAFTAERDISFGGKIYKSVLLDFVEDLPPVDYITDFKMYTYVEDPNKVDVNEVRPETPDAILVSADTHVVNEAP